MNMFHYYWLIKKLLCPMEEQNIARWEKINNAGRGRNQADAMRLPKEKVTETLLAGHSLMVIHRIIEMG